jgi:hypothetical protein
MEIIGLCGPAGSGKDLVADWLVDNKRYAKVSFSDAMKRITKELFDINQSILWGPSKERNKEVKINWDLSKKKLRDISSKWGLELLSDPWKIDSFSAKLENWFYDLFKKYPEQLSPRIALQTLGTEMGRSIDPLIWCNYVHDEIIPKLERGRIYESQYGIIHDPRKFYYSGVVIVDHRFLNEIEDTRRRGGYVIRLRRLSLEKETDVIGIKGHASEEEQKTIPDSAFNLVLQFREGISGVYEALENAFGKDQEKWMTIRSLPQTEPSQIVTEKS